VRNARTHSEDQVAQIAASIIGVSNRSQLENKHQFFADKRGRIGRYQRMEMNRVEKRKHPLIGLLIGPASKGATGANASRGIRSGSRRQRILPDRSARSPTYNAKVICVSCAASAHSEESDTPRRRTPLRTGNWAASNSALIDDKVGYITKLTRGSLDDSKGRRAMEIISFAINLEHAGDIIDKNLCGVATKKIKCKLQFSIEGATELADFHKRVLESLKIALAVFMSGDVAQARKLIAEKAELRNAAVAAADRHLERLRESRPETLETTSLHLDVLRDLKRIHSHICTVAYPVLEVAGEMPATEIAESDPITLAAPRSTIS
jgi:hypothetical protein